MPETREAAKDMAREGKIRILQKGQPVDPENFKGPVRLQVAGD